MHTNDFEELSARRTARATTRRRLSWTQCEHVDTTFEHQLLHVAEAQREWYSQTQWLMTSGGNRNILYDEPAAVTIVDPVPPHLPGSPT